MQNPYRQQYHLSTFADFRRKNEQKLLAYGLPKEIIAAIMIYIKKDDC